MVEIGDFEFYGDEGAEDRVREFIEQRDDLLKALQEAMQALEWCVEQGGGPVCEHEIGVVCFCKENKAINSARAAISKALQGFINPTNGTHQPT